MSGLQLAARTRVGAIASACVSGGSVISSGRNFSPNRECANMPAKKPTKSATPTTVTLKHLAASLADSHEIPKKQAETVLTDLVGLIVKHLKKGERIRIVGLG